MTNKTIYALFVGINEYHSPKYRLEGCVKDVEHLKNYMQTHFNNENYIFKPIMITDEQATRNAVIKGFDHFLQAKDGDICLFHYAGHGSQCVVPKSFQQFSSNNKMESFVCHDSRKTNGKDILDKELSYLIWKITKSKKIQFIAIMDCCHSGSITREIEDKEFSFTLSRQLKEREIDDATSFLGMNDYKKNDGKLTAPIGRHILLSACQNDETAKEIFIKGKRRGVFTYCLIEALQGAYNRISYLELINRTRLRINQFFTDQNPQVETISAIDKKCYFLSAAVDEKPSFLVYYNNKQERWELNIGALHGIVPAQDENTTVLQLANDLHQIRVDEVFSHYCTVKGMDLHNIFQSYKAFIISPATSPFNIAFALDNDEIGQQIIHKELTRKPASTFKFTENIQEALYLIHAKEQAYFLSFIEDSQLFTSAKKEENIRPVFKKIQGYSLKSGVKFLNQLEKVIAWKQLLTLTNGNSNIKETEIRIQLFQSLEPGNLDNDSSIKEVDWEFINRFEYDNGEAPAFQLKITNTGKRDLWLSLVYFTSDFGIYNQLIPMEKLSPKSEIWATEIWEGNEFKTIPLQLAKHHIANQITVIREYLKIFVCTESFSTDDFNQIPLVMEKPTVASDRLFGRFNRIETPDWVTKEIVFDICKDEYL